MIIKTWKWFQNWEQSNRKSVQAYGSLIVYDTYEAHETEKLIWKQYSQMQTPI